MNLVAFISKFAKEQHCLLVILMPLLVLALYSESYWIRDANASDEQAKTSNTKTVILSNAEITAAELVKIVNNPLADLLSLDIYDKSTEETLAATAHPH